MLGSKMRDKITGFEGVCTGEAKYINGCVQMCLAPPIDKDGKKVEPEWFDSQRLEIIGDGPVRVAVFQQATAGGPIADGEAPKF